MTVDKMDQSEKDARLDRLGRLLVHSGAASEEEAERVADAPFLYTRLRARIEAERERREEGESWLALLGVVWRAVPAMALIAFFALALFWTASPRAGAPAAFGVEALFRTRDAGIEHIVFADTNGLSNDEVLATIMSEDEREASR